MKKGHLRWLGLAAVCCIAIFTLMGAARDPQQQLVEELLKTRIDVMENVLYGKITYEEGKAQLKEVETDTLYRKDLENLQAFRDTDLDPVRNMEVLSFVKEGDLYGVKTYAVEIRWTSEGYDGQYSETNKYQIGVLEKRGQTRLITMEIRDQ